MTPNNLTDQQLKDLTQHQNKMKPKPKPEEIINLFLAERKEAALGFVQWLRDNKLSPAWNTTNAWRANHKKHMICFVSVCGRFWDESGDKDKIGSWRIRFNFNNNALYAEKGFFSEKIEKILHDNIGKCGGGHCYHCKGAITS